MKVSVLAWPLRSLINICSVSQVIGSLGASTLVGVSQITYKMSHFCKITTAPSFVPASLKSKHVTPSCVHHSAGQSVRQGHWVRLITRCPTCAATITTNQLDVLPLVEGTPAKRACACAPNGAGSWNAKTAKSSRCSPGHPPSAIVSGDVLHARSALHSLCPRHAPHVAGGWVFFEERDVELATLFQHLVGNVEQTVAEGNPLLQDTVVSRDGLRGIHNRGKP